MKKFVWRLQRVLDVKKKEEQKKEAELLEITEKLAHSRGELLIRKKTLESMINDLAREHPSARLPRQEFFLTYSAANDAMIEKFEAAIKELQARQKEKKDEVLRLKRFNKSLEKLRTEAKTRFMLEQDKLEQKEADEMTTIRFARKIIMQEILVNR